MKRILLPVLAILAAPQLPSLAQAGAGQWSEPTLPRELGQGGGIVATDPDTLYVLCGGGATAFLKYSIASDAWTEMAPLPEPVLLGGGIALMTGTPFIYVTAGPDATKRFYRFDTSAGPGASWSALADLPANPPTMAGGTVSTIHVALAAVSSVAGAPWPRVYAINACETSVPVMGGSMSQRSSTFWEFSPPEVAPPVGTWTRAPDTFSIAGRGAVMARLGSSNRLAALPGHGQRRVEVFTMVPGGAGSWSSLPDAPEDINSGSVLAAGPASDLYLLPGGSTNAYRFSASAWSAIAPAPAGTGYGAGMAFPPGGDVAFLAQGSGVTLRRYSLSHNLYATTLARAPLPARALVASHGGADLYARLGSAQFCHYSIASGIWSSRAPLPADAADGCSMVHTGDDFIYATRGGETTDFWRYSISGDAWTTDPLDVPPTPAPIGRGGGILWDGGDHLYALQGISGGVGFGGSPTPAFFRYSISGRTWESRRVLPQGVGQGGAMAHDGADTIFVLPGQVTKEFLAYSIQADEWTWLPNCPEFVLHGGSLCAAGDGRTLFAFPGLGNDGVGRFLAYSIPTRQWQRKENAPTTLAAGASLVRPAGGDSFYAMPGGASGELWSYRIGNWAPAITALVQTRLDGATVISNRETYESGIVVQATIEDAERHDLSRVEIELREGGLPYPGRMIVVTGPVASGATLPILIDGLQVDQTYRWRIRAIDSRGAACAWTDFGTDDPLEVDLWVRSNAAPRLASIAQVAPSTSAPLSVGQTVFEESSVRIEAVVSDPEGDEVMLRIEMRRVGDPFTGDATAWSPFSPNGSTISVTIPTLRQGYHWQYSLEDDQGASTPWTAFGGNDENEADFEGMAAGSTSRAGCLQSGRACGAAGWLAVLAVLPLLRRRTAVVIAAGIVLGNARFAEAVDVPTTIQDLRVTGGTSTSITLEWSAPWDSDPDFGPEIRHYMLRYYSSDPALFPSLEDWFNAAAEWPQTLLPRGDGLGNPAPGTPQTGTISGLTMGRTYYFAIKSESYWGDVSANSNVESGEPHADWAAPAAIGAFGAAGTTLTSAIVSWIATGDDDLAGTAQGCALSYSISPIDELNFNDATPVAGVPLSSGGTPISVEVTGLVTGRIYYFAIESWDEDQNSSGLSLASTFVGVPPPKDPHDPKPGPCSLGAGAGTLWILFGAMAVLPLRR